ncbi:DUF6458 family protein [Catelliglobosispora koreensis]|uniref:DUF6458 family protein n=1 Tax=Catelliglobosispora koreensis TaxID=129052 RepID=UPI000381E1DF|nr:DUF6458 family protein [Catelliglobosispora koreensis]
MGIGASIFLIALGAILTFALDFSVGGIDIDVVGWILMAAGVIGLVFTTLIWGPRRRATTVTEQRVPASDPVYTGRGTGYRRVEEERDI